MKEVVIIYHNHLDPEWARCYERPMLNDHAISRSYADVWDYIIDRWLDMADEGYQYTEGQAIVWRTYLNRHPERKARIKELIKNRKLEILLQGELTPETNYIPAEGLARNYLLASPFYDEFCGENYDGTRKAWIWDAFGNSANMPQVLKLAGAEMVGGTRYRACPDDFWIGIDGTVLPCIDKKIRSNTWDKNCNVYYVLSRHPRCPHCNGFGCEKCGGRGMITKNDYREDETAAFLGKLAAEEDDPVFGIIGGEETLPDRCVLNAIGKCNEEYGGRVHFRFGDVCEYWECNRAYYEKEAAKYTEPSVDLNPVHSGCYVTRIENKQRVRSLVYALIQAEAETAVNLWKEGKTAAPPAGFTLAWRNLLLNMHHDSISGAHIDEGQTELLDYLDEAESIISRHVQIKKIFTANRVARDETNAGVRRKKLGAMEISYDLRGIISITKNGRDVFGEFEYKNLTYTRNTTGRIHIGELVLNGEYGDNRDIAAEVDCVLLGAYNYAVYEGEDYVWWRGRDTVRDPGIKKLQWEIRVQASEDGERLDFVTQIDWDTANKRLKIAVPVNDGAGKSSVWEIPYGFIRRGFEPAENSPGPAPEAGEPYMVETARMGDFPALHWVRHDINEDEGVAVLNRGLPSAKWIPGCFEISLLRSPTMPGDTVMPSVEENWDIDGMRDAGKHLFEYSIWPYTKHVSPGDMTRAGYRYNRATPEVPFSVTGDVVITTFKCADDGGGFILRLQEAGGKDGGLEIQFAEEKTVTVVNLMEKPLEAPGKAAVFTRSLHRHEILTLRITD
jgi:alpha-mannosidase